MAAHRVKKGCRQCGGAVEAKGDLCARCASRRGRPAGPFVCPFCRAELSWETLGALEAEVTIYVREKIYYCPECRSFLGVSSWHTEG